MYSDKDDIPLRKLVGGSSKVVDSSDDEPLSISLRRPAAFKETGLLQPKKHKEVSTISSLSSLYLLQTSLMAPIQKPTTTFSIKIPKRAGGTDVSSATVTLFPVLWVLCQLIASEQGTCCC
jgi:hypothetical protein